MDDMTGRTAPKPKKRPNRFVRFLAFLVTLALMVGAVVLVVNYDKLNFDSLRRWFAYRSLERSDSGQAESFHFDGSASNVFASVDGDLLICSPNSIRLYSGSGQLYVDETISMENPVVSVSGGIALVYDAGGRDLFVYANREEAFSLSLEEGQSILSADVNQNGCLAVTTQESGYKGAVTVYDSGYAPLMRVSLSSRFVMDAAVSPDNRSVALLTIGLTDGSFESRVDLYAMDGSQAEAETEDAAPTWSCPVGNDTVLELCWNSSGSWALGETGLYIVSSDGSLAGSYDYGGRYLKAFSLDGDGTAVLLLAKYRAGSTGELLTVNAAGELTAALPVNEQILSLSAAGRYVGVLTADRLDIYNQQLELYNTLEGTQGAQRVLQRSDGTAMLIDGTAARLYIPQ